jgi:glycosyltransferase involved in cell wall biosynthesis
MKRIAVVTPWFGHDLKGGAEQQGREITRRLAERGLKVEVLTTCCRSFFEDWAKDHHASGEHDEHGIIVRRFPVSPRKRSAFDALNVELLSIPKAGFIPGVCPVPLDKADVWTRDNINSHELYVYLQDKAGEYDAFLFMPYLYGITLQGLPLVKEKAWLQPCLHDEAYAYLPDVEKVFHLAKGIFFNSAGEKELAGRLYGPAVHAKGIVVGEGIESEVLSGFGAELPEGLQDTPFVLFLGRRDPEKGVDFLIRSYQLFRERRPQSKMKLVLAGPGDSSYGTPERGVHDLGLVSEAHKAGLLQNTLALMQPSTNESFSRVLFESWFCARPALVHSDCLATAEAVCTSGGGWHAGCEEEWAEHLERIDDSQENDLCSIGDIGKEYALNHADWDRVMDRYVDVFAGERKAVQKPKRKLKAVHQLLPNLSYGDAISNYALYLREYLRKAGYESQIIVRYIDNRLHHEALALHTAEISPEAGVIYHHSIGSEVTSKAIDHAGPKCLIFHNITPGEFYKPYDKAHAKLLQAGWKDLEALAQEFSLSVGVSQYNADDLKRCGFHSPGVLPLTIDPAVWDHPRDGALAKALADGKRNILFVGRIAPNKCQHHLIEIFHRYLRLDSEARLILVGGAGKDKYADHVRQSIDSLGLEGHVLHTGKIDAAKLAACYAGSHLFLSASEHEGFCVPIMESMWFDLPIVAYASSAIPETLDAAGLMFTRKENFDAVAALMHMAIFDKDLRSKVLAAQRERRQDFLPVALNGRIEELLQTLEESA